MNSKILWIFDFQFRAVSNLSVWFVNQIGVTDALTSFIDTIEREKKRANATS